jgi:hypothetical protein
LLAQAGATCSIRKTIFLAQEQSTSVFTLAGQKVTFGAVNSTPAKTAF